MAGIGFDPQALLHGAEPCLSRLEELLAKLTVPTEGPAVRADAIALAGEILGETDSFWVFHDAGMQAVHEGLLRDLVAQAGVLPRGTALLPDDAGYALTLAACRVFGGCGAATPYAINRCLGVCEQPMGLVDQVHWNLAPSRVEAVERAAAFLHSRRRPPGG